MQQPTLFGEMKTETVPLQHQLLKWIGNKQRFAQQIVTLFPEKFDNYYEPFLGSGAVLGTLAPCRAVASDIFEPLIEIWRTLQKDPAQLKNWYSNRWTAVTRGKKVEEYERIKASYNARPNAADLVFLCRSCYGGVVRFRKADGFMSTPCGIHRPIPPDAFAKRVDTWRKRTSNSKFLVADFRETMEMAKSDDLVYCDPPYRDSQSILYGAQSFDLEQLLEMIGRCKSRGVYVALSIDGMKRCGRLCNVPIPKGLFEREVFVNCGRSMLRRFQMSGKTLEKEVVADRLLLTY